MAASQPLLPANRSLHCEAKPELWLGRFAAGEHTIDTGDARPFKVPMYRYPPEALVEMEKILKDLLERGCVKPSESAWASSVVLAPKKDGTWRFAVAYRGVNRLTRSDVYPLPRINTMLDDLRNGGWFT